MAYTTKEAVRIASGFADDDKITDTTIDAYIADADGVIDSYVADIYVTPLSATSEMVEMLSRAITVGLLYANEYGEESQGTDKGWKNRLDWAMGILENVQAQKQKLYTTAGVELTRSTLKEPAIYPNAADSAAGQSQEARLTMNQTF